MPRRITDIYDAMALEKAGQQELASLQPAVRIASSDAQHQVLNVGTSYIVWTKINGV